MHMGVANSNCVRAEEHDPPVKSDASLVAAIQVVLVWA